MSAKDGIPKAAAPGIAEILAAGCHLQEALDAEHALSVTLETAPPESGLYDQFHQAREHTQVALSAYNEAVRRCAEASLEEQDSESSRPGFWARLKGMGTAGGASREQVSTRRMRSVS